MVLYIIGFIVVFLLVLASGLPVGFGLGFLALGLLTLYTDFEMAMGMGIEKAYGALDSSVLVAIPLFILAAQLISATGMGKRLFDAARVFFGRMKSGLGIATIASSGVFSAMTGSSFVSASTMGLIAIPELRRAKYSDTIISAAITAGGSLGSVIPPSIVMIVYGYLTDESIARLFMAGMIPGILLIILYSLALVALSPWSIEKDKPASGPAACNTEDGAGSPSAAMNAQSEALAGVSSEDPSETEDTPFTMTHLEAIKQAFWGLMAPVIILGGIYLGIFTASEAAAIAAVYCTVIGFLVYRSLSLKKMWDILLSAANLSAMVAIIVIGGAMLGHVVVFGRIPQEILAFIIEQDYSPLFLMLLVNIILFLLGMFMEVLALMYLAIPLLFPVVMYMGWDNIWFAVILMINVNLALITPPMGGVLYVVSQIGGIPINTVLKGAMLPVIVLIFVLLLVIFFPPIATWLPSMI